MSDDVVRTYPSVTKVEPVTLPPGDRVLEPLFSTPYAKLVYDGETFAMPAGQGAPRDDQMQGSAHDQVIEFSGRTCYDDATEVLTQSGWVQFADLKRGIAVATLERATDRIEFQMPTDYLAREHDGEIYAVESTKVSLRVTMDHDLYVRHRGSQDWTFSKPTDCLGKRYEVRLAAVYEGSESSVEPILMPGRSYQQTHLEAGRGRGGRLLTMQRKSKDFRIGVEMMPAWAAFLGYYLSEGSLHRSSKSGWHPVIYQKPDGAEPIREAIRGIGIEPKERADPRNGVLHIKAGNATLARWLVRCGIRAAEKRVPDEVLHWPIRLRQILLDALFYGDGHVVGDARVYSSASKRLATDVQTLCVLSGRAATMNGPNTEGMYHVRELARETNPVINSARQHDRLERYEGKVYCVSVQNRVLLVRRNGRVLFCGNCYDSLSQPRSRDSKGYHAHIREVNHSSVNAHAALCVNLEARWFGEDTIVKKLQLACCFLDRPGCWVRDVPGGLRVMINARAVRQWQRWPSLFAWNRPVCEAIGYSIQMAFSGLAPLAGEGLPRAISNDGLRMASTLGCVVVPPEDESEVWASIYLTGSRGMSHEQVRHAFTMTAISQRSTRFCDEDGTPWVPHPLLAGGELTILASAQHDAWGAYRGMLESCKARLSDNTELGRTQATKQARGAARAALGTALETRLIFSATLMQWKWQLYQRMSEAADAEIRVLYNRVFEELKARWPDSFVGYSTTPASDGCGLVLTAWGDDPQKYGWRVA